jgi:hypothetical protein
LAASPSGFEVYDISNNNITNAAFLGNVGMTGRSWVSVMLAVAAKTT